MLQQGTQMRARRLLLSLTVYYLIIGLLVVVAVQIFPHARDVGRRFENRPWHQDARPDALACGNFAAPLAQLFVIAAHVTNRRYTICHE